MPASKLWRLGPRWQRVANGLFRQRGNCHGPEGTVSFTARSDDLGDLKKLSELQTPAALLERSVPLPLSYREGGPGRTARGAHLGTAIR